MTARLPSTLVGLWWVSVFFSMISEVFSMISDGFSKNSRHFRGQKP
jgi:hypothetical protein